MVLRKLLLSVLLFVSFNGYAQQDPFFSHFALNPLQYNAGWIGAETSGYVTLQHRSQWLGYPQGNAPTTQHLSFGLPFTGKLSGFGLNIVNDSQGPFKRFEAEIGLAYAKKLRKGSFSIGIMPGVISQSINDDLIAVQPDDPFIPSNGVSELKPNLDVGLVYTSDNGYHVGLGINNVIAPSFNFGTNGNNVLERSYTLSGGINYQVNKNVKIVPTALVRTDLQTYTLDVGALVYLKEKMWGGVTYRLEESANLLLGYSFLKDNTLKFGYSFEYVIQNRQAKQATSHEIFVRYNLPNLLIGGKKPIRTPRFSF